MKKTKEELLDEVRQWGAKLQRTNNRLSERETFGFADFIKQARSGGVTDKEIDLKLKEGRKGEAPQPRFQQAEVTRWI